MNNNQSDDLLNRIMKYKFYINDLTLYLDTHPNDETALNLHNEYVEKMNKLINKYEEIYGPLTVETIMDSWKWSQNLWPWERGFNK